MSKITNQSERSMQVTSDRRSPYNQNNVGWFRSIYRYPRRFLIDFILISLFLFPLELMRYFGIKTQPVQRGYYLNDPLLSKRYYPSTVTARSLVLTGTLMNVVAIIYIALYRYSINRNKKMVIYENLVIFIYGVIFSQALTNVLKYAIGRHRPHFLRVCRPDVNQFKCSTMENCLRQRDSIYVTTDICTGMNPTKLRESRLSFPSGHSSLALYFAVFFIIHVYISFKNAKYSILRGFLFAVVSFLTVFTCVSRITDNKHHPTDVVAGSLIGAIFAIIFERNMNVTPRHCRPSRADGLGIWRRFSGLNQYFSIINRVNNRQQTQSRSE